MSRVPAWAERFATRVANSHSVDCPIDVPLLHWYILPPGHSDGLEDAWFVCLYPALVEIVGGKSDGAVWFSWRDLDILALQKAFDDVTAFSWLPDSDDEGGTGGGCLICEGVVEGRKLQLRLDQCPPEDAPTVHYDSRTCAVWEKE